MVLEIQFWSINYTLVAKRCKNKAKDKAKAVYIRFLKSIQRFESTSTQENFVFLHYYQSYCDYLLKMGRMDGEQAVFEQLTLSDC